CRFSCSLRCKHNTQQDSQFVIASAAKQSRSINGDLLYQSALYAHAYSGSVFVRRLPHYVGQA
ncbi:MAG: hypothetical protein AAFY98_12530, partial [Verrucomicrobiota bacterium]